ncbi:11314_t:CDS:2, partial [Acaulospora colombiana]
ILSLALTGAITNILKITTGRPRPDLIDRCAPRADGPEYYEGWLEELCQWTLESYVALNPETVPGNNNRVTDGPLDHGGHTAKSWLAVLPLFGATIIAITRTMDYRHHYQDVFVGMVVGLVVAYFSYRQYYPSLEHPLCHRPYAPRFAPIEPPKSQQGENPMPAAEETTALEAQQQYHGKGKGKDIEAQMMTEGKEDVMDHDAAGT